MTDIYQAPAANLTEDATSFSGGGSIANGIAGNYSFTISDVISEAWGKINGFKGKFWLAFLIYIGITIAVVVVASLLGGSMQQPAFLGQLAQMLIGFPLMAGLYMMGVKVAAGVPTAPGAVLAYFGKILPLIGAGILMYLLVAVGMILLIIPGIYLVVAYMFATPLVVDKNLSPWEALETSRKTVTHHWFQVFGLLIVNMLIVMIAAIPLGIGLIWALPLVIVTYGILYTKMFGFGSNTETL